MQEFSALFFNGISPAIFLFTFICFLSGFALLHFIRVNKAVKNKTNTPDSFDIRYWLSDNYKSIGAFLIISYLVIRFTPEVLSLAGIGDVFAEYTGTPFAFVVLGFAYEKINNALRKAASKTKK